MPRKTMSVNDASTDESTSTYVHVVGSDGMGRARECGGSLVYNDLQLI